jgi:hypothetical protein
MAPKKAPTQNSEITNNSLSVMRWPNVLAYKNEIPGFRKNMNETGKYVLMKSTRRGEIRAVERNLQAVRNALRLKSAAAAEAASAPPAAKKREPAEPGKTKEKKVKMVSDANVAKSYYLLSIALGNVNGIPTDPIQKARLVNAARKFRLATKAQLASWAGSFLETTGFNKGAKRNQGVEVEDGLQTNKPTAKVPHGGQPKWLIYKDGSEAREPRTAPTIFLKTAWDMDLIKGANAVAKSRRVMPPNLAKNMNDLVKFTETLINTQNNTGGNANDVLAGKTKGTTQIQPDIILTIPSKREIHIYELKIGAGKKETIPAESIQLAKMKYILDVHLGDETPKWKVIPHFLPWRFGQMNQASLNFKNWEKTQIKGVKKIADALVAWAAANPSERGSYRINRSTKTNKPLSNYLNINITNKVLGLSHIGRIGNAVSGGGVVRAESYKKQIENQMGAGGINGVKEYIKLANSRGGNSRIPSVDAIQRVLRDDLMKQLQFYFVNVENRNLVANKWFENQNLLPRGGHAASGITNYVKGSVSHEVKQARLARSVIISDAFVTAMRQVAPTRLLKRLEELVNHAKTLLASGGLKIANTTYNANTRNILNAVQANRTLQADRVYAKFLEKFGNSAKNLASKAILQTLAANQSLTNNTRTRAKFLLENFNAGINAARSRALRVPPFRRP